MATNNTLRARERSTAYRCSECGWTTVKWVGRCGECQAWGTVAEAGDGRPRTTPPARAVPAPARIGDVDRTAAVARATGVGEFDRVLKGAIDGIHAASIT